MPQVLTGYFQVTAEGWKTLLSFSFLNNIKLKVVVVWVFFK